MFLSPSIEVSRLEGFGWKLRGNFDELAKWFPLTEDNGSALIMNLRVRDNHDDLEKVKIRHVRSKHTLEET